MKHTPESVRSEIKAVAVAAAILDDKNYTVNAMCVRRVATMLSDLLAENERMRALLTKIRDSFLFEDEDVPTGIGVMQEADNHYFSHICAALTPESKE